MAADSLPPSTGRVHAPRREEIAEGNRGLEPAQGLEVEVDALLRQMSQQQKLAELSGHGPQPVDGFYLSGGIAELGVPALRMVDGPRGVRAGKATAFPVSIARGASFDPELERRVGRAVGREVAAKGGNVVLAPCMNLLYHPGWGRAQETYSEDPVHMGWMATAFVHGAQQTVMASAKHFAVNSVENTRFSMSAELSERTLREVYLPHFRRVVTEAKVASVMSAYNRVRGTYCGEHPHLLGRVLRGDWGFDGFVESDWFLGTPSTAPALSAGLDIEMPAPGFFAAEKVQAALDAGELTQEVIDRAVRRVLRQKLRFRAAATETPTADVVECEEHRRLAREAAREGCVLLKNEGALPIGPERLGRVALVGRLATFANLGDRGSSAVIPTRAVTPAEGLCELLGEERVAVLPADELSAEQLAEVASADLAVVVVGLTYRDEGEFIPVAQQEAEEGEFARGGDRGALSLPEAQQRLIARVVERARRTVVVLEAGAAVLVEPWIDHVDALLVAWYPGMEGGRAIAELLVGEHSPSGKLPLSFPRSEAQLPPWDITAQRVDYDEPHGYFRIDAQGQEPRFPFGFGLGYTRFALGRLRLGAATVSAGQSVRVEVDVHNAGDRRGAEVVQVYASSPESRVTRPRRRLVAFGRVELEPGEVRTLELEVRAEDLCHWDLASERLVLEDLEHELWVGTSSRSLPLSAKLRSLP